MSERYWQSPVPRAATPLVLLAVAGAAAITGCSPSGAGSGAGAAPSMTSSSAGAAGTPSMTPSARMAAAGKAGRISSRAAVARTSHLAPAARNAAANLPVSFTAAQLRGALLTSVNGERPAAAPETGSYGNLPDVQASKQSMRGVTVTPAQCAQATGTTFNSATFAHEPASVVTFRVGPDGISEVIVGASPTAAAQALAATLPAGCAHYQATFEGRTFNYAVKTIAMGGIAEQATALNVKAAGYSAVNVWSVVFRANGYVGAVTIVGPDASQRAAKVLAEYAYSRAARSLR